MNIGHICDLIKAALQKRDLVLFVSNESEVHSCAICGGRPERVVRPPSLPSGSVGRSFAAIHEVLNPVLYLLLDPEGLGISAAVAKLHSLGEEACILKPLDVLRAVRHQFQDLSL